MEQLDLSEFDALEIMTLQDVVGLESFVSPISEKEYLANFARNCLMVTGPRLG